MASMKLPYFQYPDVLEHLKENYYISKGLTTNQESSFNNYLEWLSKTPMYTTYRVNTTLISSSDALELLRKNIEKHSDTPAPDLSIHPLLPDILVAGSVNNSPKVVDNEYEVIVDSLCGAAVLRGAHVFAPGILGMSSKVKYKDSVSVWTDLEGGCLRGYKKNYEGKKLYVGHGLALLTRQQLFEKDNQKSGVAIQMTSTVSGCVCLPVDCTLLRSSPAPLLLQNLPSIICGWALNPHPGELVLDACAAPGNKTTHLASLMKNQGVIIAIDKTNAKIDLIKRNCIKMSATNVRAFAFDTTKAVIGTGDGKISKCPSVDPPPYHLNTFDKVLLDAPCSALGQRPQLANRISLSQLKSYPPLQRRLFKSAVALCKEGGYILYSTCTITAAENEEMVSWALKTFSCLRLVPVLPGINGREGWPVEGLNPEQCAKVLRFGPPQEISHGSLSCDLDTVGFFIASFYKEKTSS